MQKIYRRTSMPKCDFNKVAKQNKPYLMLFNFIEITLRHGCSPVNLLHIFKRPFLKNTSGRLLLLLLRFNRLRHSSSWFLYHLPGKQTWTNSVKYFWNEMPSFSVAIDSMISSVKSCHIFSLFGKCC